MKQRLARQPEGPLWKVMLLRKLSSKIVETTYTIKLVACVISSRTRQEWVVGRIMQPPKHDVLPSKAVLSSRAHYHRWGLLPGTTSKDSAYSYAESCHRRKVDLTIEC